MTERRWHLAMLAPYLLGLAVLIVLPAAVTFGLSLFEYDFVRRANWLGLSNFTELFDDEVFWRAVRNSLIFTGVATPLRLLAALALALLLARRMAAGAFYRSATVLPSVVPDVAYALLWLWLLNPLYGPLNVTLEWLGFDAPRWFTDGGDARAAIVLMSLFQIGEGFVVALAVRRQIPNALYELALVEAARPWYSLTRITLPLMAPFLLLLLFRDTIFSFQATFVPALLVTQGGPPFYETTFLPLFVYREGFEYFRYGYAAAATLVMFVVTAAIIVVQLAIVRRWRHAWRDA